MNVIGRLTSSFQKGFTPVSKIEDEARQEFTTKLIITLVNIVILVFTGIILGGAALGWIELDVESWRILAVLGGTGLANWILLRQNLWKAGGVALVFVMFSLAVFGSAITQSTNTFLFYYPLSIILTALLMGRRAMWWAAFFSFTIHAAVRVVQWGGDLQEILPQLIMFTSMILGMTILEAILISQHQAAIQQLKAQSEQQAIMLRDLQLSEHRLRMVVTNMPVVLFSTDQNGTFILSEGKTLKLLGLTPGQVVGLSLFDVYRDFPEIIESTRIALGGETAVAVSEVAGLVFDVIYSPIKAEDGTVTGVIGVANDVTESRRAQEKAQRSRERMNVLYQIDQAIINSMDLEQVLPVVLRLIADYLKVDAVDIFLIDRSHFLLRSAQSVGFRQPPGELVLTMTAGIPGLVATSRHTVHIPHLGECQDDWHAYAGYWETEGFISYFGVPLLSKGKVRGVLELFTRQPFQPDADWLEFLNVLCGQAAIAIDNALLFHDLEQSNLDLNLAYDLTLEGWAKALEMRDKETEGHSQRVVSLTVQLAEHLGVPQGELTHIRRGALLHDIGKLGIPDQILLKPDRLTEDEWRIMRMHPVYARQLLAGIPYLALSIEIPYGHHEHWDGSGYPRGLCGEQIPLAARIFTIVDVWDALRDNRPYRSAWSDADTLAYIQQQSGRIFDPAIVPVFLEMVQKH